MALTEAFNGGAHGNIHGLLGGTWSPEADVFASQTPYIVIPFVHHTYVSLGVSPHELDKYGGGITGVRGDKFG